MGRFFNITIDLIEELQNLTIRDLDFDWWEWSRWDVERLRRIADYIEREILINEKKKESHEPV